jgi:hypothetical protein
LSERDGDRESKTIITHASGEKCATALLTDIHVGNAIPVNDKKKMEISVKIALRVKGRKDRKPNTMRFL